MDDVAEDDALMAILVPPNNNPPDDDDLAVPVVAVVYNGGANVIEDVAGAASNVGGRVAYKRATPLKLSVLAQIEVSPK
jgi:hypothetical protein